jgi:hypothetical protein
MMKMKITKELYEQFDKTGKAIIAEDGGEILDDRKIDLPVGVQRPPSLVEQIKRLMRGPLAQQAREQEMESFEESDDFEWDDPEETEMDTPYAVNAEDLPVTMEMEEPPADYPAEEAPGESAAEPEPVTAEDKKA